MDAYNFNIVENQLQFRNVEQNQVDGIQLSQEEREYLLPHFLMLLVGKPGSGKTTLLKQLVTNPQMYYKKFNDVLLVSPSHSKMGINIKKDNVHDQFSLDWLFQKFAAINEEQTDTVFGKKTDKNIKNKKSTNKDSLAGQIAMSDGRSRFAFIQPPVLPTADTAAKKQPVPQQSMIDPSNEKLYKELKKMPQQLQEMTHRNILVILDDVVGAVKKAEYDPRLAQLVMNRRHIIFNGTISIIMVTQKYTLIPSRVRSNANWLILYQLNPLDFETAYRDAVTMSLGQWRDVLHFVYGITTDTKSYKHSKEYANYRTPAVEEEVKEEEKTQTDEKKPAAISAVLKGKKFENLGIWVESNIYFKNFKRIEM